MVQTETNDAASQEMTANEFFERAQSAGLTEQQAIALFDRRVANISRQVVAENLGTSRSNVDNLERAARKKIKSAQVLVDLAKSVGINPHAL